VGFQKELKDLAKADRHIAEGVARLVKMRNEVLRRRENGQPTAELNKAIGVFE
jgi:hypothetical protein